METIYVKDFMTSEVVSVRPYDRTVDVVKILFINGFNGVPVVENDNVLVGLVTEFDFIEKGSPVYFSPMGRILEELTLFKEDESEIEHKIKEIISSKAEDVMNRDPLTLLSTNTLKEAADLFIRHHRINPIPVVDRERRVVGIVARYDLIKLYADPTFLMKFLTKNNKSI